MLSSRAEQDGLARARLSHAIRSQASSEKWFFVSSNNLDELAKRFLPGVDQQLENLVRWLAAKLGDNRFGRIVCPPSETLAGLVGTADGRGVTRLIEYGTKKGIVELTAADGEIGLSPEGWAIVEPKKVERAAVGRQPAPPASVPKIVKAHCNKCGGERNAFERASHSVDGHNDETRWSDTYDVLECCGCSGMIVRHKSWFSEWDDFDEDPLTGEPRLNPGIKVTYWPPPTTQIKPAWADSLEDRVLRQVIGEVYQAMNGGLMVLASIGTRTLLDRAMFLRVGDPRNGFAGKLDAMVEKGHIGATEREILETITDAGNAAAHRGFAPTPGTLVTIVETVENFLQREFVLQSAAGDVRAATPRRSDR